MGVGLFCQVTNDRKRGNGLKFLQRKFGWALRKKFDTERVNENSKKIPREVLEAQWLEVPKRCVDMALRDCVKISKNRNAYVIIIGI